MEQQEQADMNREIAPELSDEENIDILKEAVAEEKENAANNLAGWKRAQADLENYRRRAEQEKGEIARFGNTQIMLGLLPVIDDLERAIDSVPSDLADNSWVDGMRLITRKLRMNLEAQGLTQIKALGEQFDPNIHEAVMQAQGEEGKVVEEIEKGYKLNDRLIRPSKVVVGSGEEKEE
jgi:molecular chaperone GrpE